MQHKGDNDAMSSTKAYLVRAFHEWILDNNCTPYLVIDATLPNVHVPRQYVDGGRIVLNISDTAVKSLHLNNDAVEFQARFSGRLMDIYAPIHAVIAIYAKENGRGMVFPDEEHAEDADGTTTPPPMTSIDQSVTQGEQQKPPKKGKPDLRVIK